MFGCRVIRWWLVVIEDEVVGVFRGLFEGDLGWREVFLEGGVVGL